MILKALYDYYNRCDNLPAKGMEEKEIGFLIVLSPEGQFLRFEDCRTGKDHARVYLVKKHVGRSSAAVANYLYDNSAYVLGYSEKSNGKEQLYFDTFKAKVESIADVYPDNKDIIAIRKFYNNSRETILGLVSQDGRRLVELEWDEQARKTYYANYGDVPFGDITKEAVKNKIPKGFDILCA